MNEWDSDGRIVDVSTAASKDRIQRSESLRNVPVPVPNAPSLENAPKPFFIFEWLDQVNPDDFEVARRKLQTTKKARRCISKDRDSEEKVGKGHFAA